MAPLQYTISIKLTPPLMQVTLKLNLYIGGNALPWLTAIYAKCKLTSGLKA